MVGKLSSEGRGRVEERRGSVGKFGASCSGGEPLSSEKDRGKDLCGLVVGNEVFAGEDGTRGVGKLVDDGAS